MSKTTRVKPQTYATREEFLAAVDRAADLDVMIRYINARRDKAVLRVTEKFAEKAAPHVAELKAIMALAEKYAEENREELLPKKAKRKSLDTKVATFGFAEGKRSVKLLHGIKEEGAVESLHTARLDRFVRTKEEVARDAILIECKDDETLLRPVIDLKTGKPVLDEHQQPKMEAVKLSMVGLKISQGESFYVKARVEMAEPMKAEAAA